MTGEAVRELGDDVRGRGRDQEQIRRDRRARYGRDASFAFRRRSSVVTGFFESVCKVSGVMNSVASFVITTKTSWPCFTSRLASSADL